MYTYKTGYIGGKPLGFLVMVAGSGLGLLSGLLIEERGVGVVGGSDAYWSYGRAVGGREEFFLRAGGGVVVNF